MSTRNLLDEALRLPAAERGQLVRDLIRSLESETDDPSAVEQAWATELEERATRALNGDSSSRSLDAACDELDSKRRNRG